MQRRRVSIALNEPDMPMSSAITADNFREIVASAGHDSELVVPILVTFLVSEFRCSDDTVCKLLEGPKGRALADDFVRAVGPAEATPEAVMAHFERRLTTERFRSWLAKGLFEAWAQDDFEGNHLSSDIWNAPPDDTRN